MARCVMAVVGVAPCQCFSPGGNQITSPGRISSIGPPQRWARPQPAVTISVWPSGWLCHAVRAPGSNVTLAPTVRAGSGASKRGSMRTVPVKYSSDPLPEGCKPTRLISIAVLPLWVCYPLLTCLALSDLRSQQRLDGAALVHGAVALRHLVQGQGEIEDAARVDCPVPHQLDQLGQEAAHRSGTAEQADVGEEQPFAVQLDPVRDANVAHGPAWAGGTDGL